MWQIVNKYTQEDRDNAARLVGYVCNADVSFLVAALNLGLEGERRGHAIELAERRWYAERRSQP